MTRQLNAVKEDKCSVKVLEKFRGNPIHPDILELTGILEGKYPSGTTYDEMRYEYFKERYNL